MCSNYSRTAPLSRWKFPGMNLRMWRREATFAEEAFFWLDLMLAAAETSLEILCCCIGPCNELPNRFTNEHVERAPEQVPGGAPQSAVQGGAEAGERDVWGRQEEGPWVRLPAST